MIFESLSRDDPRWIGNSCPEPFPCSHRPRVHPVHFVHKVQGVDFVDEVDGVDGVDAKALWAAGLGGCRPYGLRFLPR